MASSFTGRNLRRLSERLGIRLVPLAGIAAAVFGIIALKRMHQTTVVANAVTAGPATNHGSELPATVESVEVVAGARVAAGAVLAKLRSLELQAARNELSLAIERTVRAGVLEQLKSSLDSNEAALAALARLSQAERDREKAKADRELQATLVETNQEYLGRMEELAKAGVIEERAVWLQRQQISRQTSLETQADALLAAEIARTSTLRRELTGKVPATTLVQATARLYETELSLLEQRRADLDKKIDSLTVRSRIDGIVSEVLERGSVVEPGQTVVRVVPDHASEVIAYLPPDRPAPASSSAVSFSVRLADGRHCDGSGVARASAEVLAKPGQLVSILDLSHYGFPVRMTLPAGCVVPVGQVVELHTGTL